MILGLSKEELQEALFWDDILAAYCRPPMADPGPGYGMPGI